MTTDTFTAKEVIDALEEALELNANSSDYHRLPDWVCRVLRYHLDCLKAHQAEKASRQAMCEAELAPFKVIFEIKKAKLEREIAMLEARKPPQSSMPSTYGGLV